MTAEKRSIVRPETHTVVREDDPDFDRFCHEGVGTISRQLRVWVASDRGDHALEAPCFQPSHYLGSVALLDGFFPSRVEARRLFRRVAEVLDEVEQPTGTEREELLRLLRDYVVQARSRDSNIERRGTPILDP